MLKAAVLAALTLLAQDREMSWGRADAPRALRIINGEDGKPATLIVETPGDYRSPVKADIAQAPWDLLDMARWAEPRLLADAPSPGDYRVVLEDGAGGREVGQRSGAWTSIRTAIGDDDQEEVTGAGLRINLRADRLVIYRAGPQVTAFMTVHPTTGPDGKAGGTFLGQPCAWGRREQTFDSGVMMCTTADGIVLARQELSPYEAPPLLKAVALKRGPVPLADVLPSRARLQTYAWRP